MTSTNTPAPAAQSTHTPDDACHVELGVTALATIEAFLDLDITPDWQAVKVDMQALRLAHAKLAADNAALLAALEDALASLARLPDVPGAYRVTCLQQARAALAAARGIDA